MQIGLQHTYIKLMSGIDIVMVYACSSHEWLAKLKRHGVIQAKGGCLELMTSVAPTDFENRQVACYKAALFDTVKENDHWGYTVKQRRSVWWQGKTACMLSNRLSSENDTAIIGVVAKNAADEIEAIRPY